MKLQILSDLHLEHYEDSKGLLKKLNNDKADCVLMAGDIFCGRNMERQFDSVHEAFCKNNTEKQIIIIPGNHEYYGSSINHINNELEELSDKWGFIFLNDSHKFISDKCVVIGGNGWYGDYNSQGPKINDFTQIIDFSMNVYEAMNLSSDSYKYFSWAMEKFHSDHKIICMTHVAPVQNMTPKKYYGSVYNKFFTNNWYNLIAEFNPVLWISGHWHQYKRIKIGDTELIENSYGYPHEDGAKGFKKNLIFEI